MNDSDEKHLYPISRAFLDRFCIVPVRMPDTKTERRIIEYRIEAQERDGFWKFSNKRDKRLEASTESYLELVGRVREFADKNSSPECCISIRNTIQMVDILLQDMRKGLKDVNAGFDHAVLSSIVPVIERAPEQVIRCLLREEKILRAFPRSAKRIEQCLKPHSAISEIDASI